MSPELFVKLYYPFAASTASLGVPALFSLAQAALETGWGDNAPGNMMFGVKDTDGVNGNEQLITTTEYHDSPNVKYPVILAITEVVAGKRWKYKVKDWFRKYPTPEESFRDHARFLQANKRYRQAFTYSADPYRFAQEVCAAGYATAPDYYATLQQVMKKIESLLPEGTVA